MSTSSSTTSQSPSPSHSPSSSSRRSRRRRFFCMPNPPRRWRFWSFARPAAQRPAANKLHILSHAPSDTSSCDADVDTEDPVTTTTPPSKRTPLPSSSQPQPSMLPLPLQQQQQQQVEEEQVEEEEEQVLEDEEEVDDPSNAKSMFGRCESRGSVRSRGAVLNIHRFQDDDDDDDLDDLFDDTASIGEPGAAANDDLWETLSLPPISGDVPLPMDMDMQIGEREREREREDEVELLQRAGDAMGTEVAKQKDMSMFTVPDDLRRQWEADVTEHNERLGQVSSSSSSSSKDGRERLDIRALVPAFVANCDWMN